MSQFHAQCRFCNSDGFRCSNFYEISGARPTANELFCSTHKEVDSTEYLRYASLDGTIKQSYMGHVNSEREACCEMSEAKLDDHIAYWEAIIANARTMLMTARSVKADRLDKMSEEERIARRKIKVIPRANSTNKKSDSKSAAQPQKKTMKNDPVGYLMQKFGLSFEDAQKMLSSGDE
jgi:hypothetical protein